MSTFPPGSLTSATLLAQAKDFADKKAEALWG